jgi:hypothetical protein
MSFFAPEQRYQMLCAIKRGHNNPHLPKGPLTEEEEQFIQDYAWKKVQEVLKDPEIQAVMDRLYEDRWAHRFD